MENRNKFIANIKIISDFNSSEIEIENAKNECLYILANCNYNFEEQAINRSYRWIDFYHFKILLKKLFFRSNTTVNKLSAWDP